MEVSNETETQQILDSQPFLHARMGYNIIKWTPLAKGKLQDKNVPMHASKNMHFDILNVCTKIIKKGYICIYTQSQIWIDTRME